MFGNRIREIFIYAGSSAILLAFAHIHHSLWFLSLFALVPFLRHLCRVTPKESIGMGVILATTYFVTTNLNGLYSAPLMFMFKLSLLNIAFAFFSYSINRVKNSLGLDPILITILWFPFGFFLHQYVGINDSVLLAQAGSSITTGFSSLLGVLLCSAIMILGNSLMLLFARFAKQIIFRKANYKTKPKKYFIYISEPSVKRNFWKYTHNLRAPPIIIQH